MSRLISLEQSLNVLAFIGVLSVFAWLSQPVALTAQAQGRGQDGGRIFCATAVCQEWLSVGGVQWNTDTQSLEVGPLKVHPSIASRPDACFVGLYLIIVDPEGRQLGELVSSHVIAPLEDCQKNGLVWIEPASIPWDRNGGTFSGPAGVCVMAQVFDRNGRPVKNADDELCDVVEIP